MFRFLMIATLLCGGFCARNAWAQPDCDDWPGFDFFESATAADVKECLVAGVDINARDRGSWSALHWAVLDSHAETVALLIESGAEVNVSTEDGLTPLHVAAAFGAAETVATLIKAGANTRALDNDGRLPADLAEDNDKVKNHDMFRILDATRRE
ncbi:MAG: ankyrin repeat domain-containing protein [Hyphomonadaceae bacterium]|nr:ankyrin repeat domain-containing protein [Hyphomonadaceae bacterium]MBC6412817.1 ankyrin repeat domain-containing protein [Hyphomonadaceae bacterium]